MRSILILSALCVSHVALAAEAPVFDIAGHHYGVVRRDVVPARQTWYGVLSTDLVRDMDVGVEFRSCIVDDGAGSVEADCETGKPQQ